MGLYSAAVLARNPAGYWRVDETSGAVAADLGSGANPGSYAGGAVLGALSMVDDGFSVNLRTPGARMVVPDAASADFGDGPLTWICWGRRSDFAAVFHVLMGKTTQGILEIEPSGALAFENDSVTIARSSATITDNLAHMLAVTRSGAGAGNTRIVIDGVDLTVDVTPAAVVATNAVPLVIGAYNGAGALPFGGDMDEPATFPAVLTIPQLATLFAARQNIAAVSGGGAGLPPIRKRGF